MDRIKFLNGVAVGATGTALPLWLSNFFQRRAPTPGAPSCEAPLSQEHPDNAQTTPKTLAEAYARAQQLGRPLLVLGIPADSLKWEWGGVYGAFLNFASDAALIVLSLCELYCAPLSEIEDFAHLKSPPMMVLLETEQSAPVAQPIDFDPAKLLLSEPYNLEDEPLDAMYNNIIDAMSKALRKAIVGQSATPDSAFATTGTSLLPRRQAQLSAVYPEAQTLASELFRGMAPLSETHKVAAFLYAYTTNDRGRKAQLLLLQEVRLRLCLQPPSGARWANSGGCGATIEGEKSDSMMACGMGHTPKKSQRFLYFFTDNRGL